MSRISVGVKVTPASPVKLPRVPDGTVRGSAMPTPNPTFFESSRITFGSMVMSPMENVDTSVAPTTPRESLPLYRNSGMSRPRERYFHREIDAFTSAASCPVTTPSSPDPSL